MKFLKDNIGEYLYELQAQKYLINRTRKAPISKEDVDSLDFTKIKNLCLSNESVSPRIEKRYLQQIYI